jgi:hypothetical protein
MLLPGELVCRADGASARRRRSAYPILYQAIRLIDAISENELCGLIDIDENFIGVFLRYDPEYGDSHCHVLFNEEVLLVSNDYLMSYPNASPILSSGSGQ